MSISLGLLGILCFWGAWRLFKLAGRRKIVMNPESYGEWIGSRAGISGLLMLGILASLAGVILLVVAVVR